ncbi:hypothetical protein MVLG_04488 [Microbotryum lychnidis-dioicae p1A1 Lamole]|uniref:Uncharacterized protein n=1 Tax=Microbotryum lychnidis-dioicae (strain p1A1 Lamole / MvSl-1064) TaxID=683840 RepID=U5HBD6_USTV1|nr:hypothetical protein MVLG_04488 [Microbotryum lychnidis-dioicae p1A1 Lamole]|eukprot:KDE05147.1 hypothetical protein MVLG_04488 [Microbotryum lychnidis-dioicae p1A1 Lamole]
MLEDQVAAPQVEAQFAALQARTDELVKVEETFEADNQETIIKAVEECVAGAGPRPSDAAAVDEVDRTQVAEVKGGSTCCGVIQTTTRLSAERAQAQPDAKAATKAAIATATATATTSSAPAFAPKVDVDALFVGKLKELEAGRLASQQQAIQAAVTEALARQATENDAHVATQLQETRNNMPGRVAHELLQANGGVPLPDTTATPAAFGSAPSSPAPAPAPAAAPATPTLALRATSRARGGAAARLGAIRGGQGGELGTAATGASPNRQGAAGASEAPWN